MTSLSTYAEQHNLYIKKEKYNTDYNFYNYNKFRLQKILPITYRSSTLFLDGIYFELPKSRILQIKKRGNSMIYEIIININIDKEHEIYNVLNNINEYNKNFFELNKEKFVLKVTKSNKRIITRNYRDNQNLRNDITTKFIPPLKNPLIKKYVYNPFYYVNNDNAITMTLLIKHNYLLKIIELILLNIKDNNSEYYNKINKLNSILIDTEYFELKREELNYDLSSIELLINFWIKANTFLGDEKTELINMLWYVCDYKC